MADSEYYLYRIAQYNAESEAQRELIRKISIESAWSLETTSYTVKYLLQYIKMQDIEKVYAQSGTRGLAILYEQVKLMQCSQN